MSSVSQASAARTGLLARVQPWIWVAIAAILVIVLAPVWRQVLATAAQGHLHGPDLARFARLPLAFKLHILGAVSAIAVGAALMTLRKGRTFHRTAGWLWVGLVSLVAGSSLFITSLNHGRWSLLHLLTGWTLIILPVGVLAARRHKVAQHRRTMMGLFYGGFAINAFIAFIPGRTMWALFMG